LSESEQIAYYEKTTAEMRGILKAVAHSLVFSDLKAEVVAALLGTMIWREYSDGEAVIETTVESPHRQQEFSYFYVVISGRIDVIFEETADPISLSPARRNNALNVSVSSALSSALTMSVGEEDGKYLRDGVATFTAGETFGEDALLFGRNSIASAKAVGTTQVWLLLKKNYKSILRIYNEKEVAEKKKLLKTVPSLMVLDVVQLGKLIDALEPVTYEEGETILTKGEVGDRFYILKDGGVLVQEEEGVTKLKLGPGSLFGERALVDDVVRTATIIAEEKGAMCYYLDRDAFQDILGPVEDVWRWTTLRNVPLLTALSDAQVMELVGKLAPRHTMIGEAVCSKGEYGGCMYIVERGCFEVFSEDQCDETVDNTPQRPRRTPFRPSFPEKLNSTSPSFNSTNHHNGGQLVNGELRRSKSLDDKSPVFAGMAAGDVKKRELSCHEYKPQVKMMGTFLTKGAFFGEYALLNNALRSATISCVSMDGTVLELSKAAFEQTLGSLASVVEAWKMHVLLQVPMMRSLSTKDQRELARLLVPRAYNNREKILEKGCRGVGLYLVEAGEVDLEKENGEVVTLGKGQFFGESSFLKNAVSREEARAVGNPILLNLSLHSCSPPVQQELCEVLRSAELGFQASNNAPKSVTDLKRMCIIGAGGYGKVVLVKYAEHLFALKSVLKQALGNQEALRHLQDELSSMLNIRNCRWIVSLLATYQDQYYVYMLLEAVMGGNLRKHILRQPDRRLPEEHARFYMACVIQALDHIHSRRYIHRDLKTENVLIMPSGYVKLADFGFAKRIPKGHKTYTTCGTPAYMAPEIITHGGHGPAVDWWCVGIMLYEMTCGRTPFQGGTTQVQKLRSIVKGRYKIPDTMSSACKSLVTKLLNVNPSRRLGNLRGGSQDIKSHPFFQDFDWQTHSAQTMPPPYLPDLTDAEDRRYVKCDDEKTMRKIWMMEVKYKDPTRAAEIAGDKRFSGF